MVLNDTNNGTITHSNVLVDSFFFGILFEGILVAIWPLYIECESECIMGGRR